MSSKKKWCPLLSITPTHQNKQECVCIGPECAWWCDWTKSCAMVAIPGEISDRMHDIVTTIEK